MSIGRSLSHLEPEHRQKGLTDNIGNKLSKKYKSPKSKIGTAEKKSGDTEQKKPGLGEIDNINDSHKHGLRNLSWQFVMPNT
jgi:hypothetical protein